MFHLKRFKPFALLVSLFFLGLLFTLHPFLANYENKLVMNKSLRPKPTRNDDLYTDHDMNKHLSLLRQGFKKTLDEYEASRRILGKRFTDAVINASFSNLVGKISKKHISCNNGLFLLIQVHSLPENFMSREAIRLSWGSKDRFIGNPQENNATLR